MSVRPHAWNNSDPTGRIFMKFDTSVFLESRSKKFQFSLTSDKNIRHFTWRCVHIYGNVMSRWFHLRLRYVSDKSCIENQNTHFMFNKFFPAKSYRLLGIVEKYCRAGQATTFNVSHAHCMLYNWGYRCTLRICNTYCFSVATMVTWTRLIVPLYEGKSLNNRNFILKCMWKVCTTKNLILGLQNVSLAICHIGVVTVKQFEPAQ